LPDDRNLSARSRSAVREILLGEGKAATTPFGASYLHPHGIPLSFLPEIDIAEKYPPWDGKVGYRSLFHDLDEAGIRWLYAGWPSLNDYQLRRDGDAVSWVLEQVRSEHALVHVQFCELDAAGHRFGPGSREVVQSLAETDRLVRLLVEGLASLGQPLDIILFGDHGMVSVVKEIDVSRRLLELRAQAPADYFYFLDSTVARFWYNHAAARREVREALQTLDGGRLLSPADKAGFGIDGLDPRSGEDIFLMEPGCLIAPSFFHGEGQSPRGMHGYDPGVSDNQGIFLAAGPHFRPGTDAGVVEATRLYPLCRSILLHSADSVSFGRNTEPAQHSQGGPRELAISRDLKAIRRCIAKLDPNPEKTVILAGSFGRGEGAVVVEDGRGRAVNDYDVLVFSKTKIDPAVLKAARERLAKEAGLPFMDLSWLDPEWASVPDLTLFRYDFRYGARVVAGDYGFLDRLPHWAENEIPSAEVLRLLCNRAAGVLIGLIPAVLSSKEPLGGDREFLWIQAMKAGTALADHHLTNWGAYHTSYRVRRGRFAILGASSGIAPDLRAAVDACFSFKLDPASVLLENPLEVWGIIRPAFMDAVCARMAFDTRSQAPSSAGGGDLRTETVRYLEIHRAKGAIAAEAVRALAPLLLDTLDREFNASARRIEDFIQVPQTADLLGELSMPNETAPREAFEYLRKRVVALWEEHCH